MSVTEVIAGWSRELSEVGGRNTLLWAPEQPGAYLDLTTAHPGGVSMLLAGRRTALSDLVREAAAFEEALHTARRVFHAERALRRDRGLSTGFVAVGVASWDPPRARAVVEAPVLLRTATLTPTGPGEHDFEIDLGRGVEVNPALVNYLTTVAGIAIDPLSLAGLTDVAAGFDPYPVYAALGRLCADVPGFAVSPRLVLGTYPYGKPAMVADLGANAPWLAQVDLVAALAGDKSAAARLDTELPGVDTDPDPEREILVVDLDGAQQSVLDAVRAGHQLVVNAPLGTGRTQTLAALIASLAHDDKRILYVTPQHDSIRDLRDRLDTVGLGDLLLDLTGVAEDRTRVTRELGAALRRAAALDDDELADAAEPRGRIARATTVADAQQHLRDHVQALHEVRRPWGVSAYEIQEAMAELAARTPAPGSRVRLDAGTLQGLDRDRVAGLAIRLQAAAEAQAWATEAGGDPWYAADITTADEVTRAAEIVTRLGGDGLKVPAAHLDAILGESNIRPAHTPRDWRQALDTMRGVRQTLEVFRPEIFDVPLDEHLLATGGAAYRAGRPDDLGPVQRARVRKQARRLLRPGRPPADLHAELLAAQAQRQAWQRLVGAGGRPEISARLDEADAAYDALAGDLGWLGERLSDTDDDADLLGMPLPRLRARLARLRDRLARLQVLPAVADTLAELRTLGLGDVVDDFASRGVSAEQVPAELEHIWWASLAQWVTSKDPRYARHDGIALRDKITQLSEHNRQSRLSDAQRVRAVIDRRVRRRTREHPRQTDLVHAQAGLTRGHLPFAHLFREAEQVLTALRPALATNPYTVAQLLGPGTSFDVVIIDDASTVTVAEAISAISRGSHAVVVGDRQGVRPAGFRVGMGWSAVPTPADQPGDVSLLQAVSPVLPQRSLTWWHADGDARLAMDERTELTAGAPAPTAAPAVRLHHTDGTAEHLPANDSAIEWTAAEADAVVDLLVQAVRQDAERSLAVVALTEAIAGCIRERIRATVAVLPHQDPVAVALTDIGRSEPFEVVTLDRAAALRRDLIVIAVGYGRTPHGRVLHRFPSLAGEHAADDLAGATALARRELVVASTLTAADLDPARLRTPGAARLRELLVHAEAGGARAVLTEAPDTGVDPVLHYLANRLRQEGLTVAEDFGCGAHRIDLAVGHPSLPGRWLVAVEADGTRYAALPGVRGRDVLRPAQLQALGWRHLRVWSTDVYRDPAREVARVLAAVKSLVGAGKPATQPTATPKPPDAPVVPTRSRDDSDIGWGELAEEGSAHDRWLQEQRPPHWQ